MINKQNMIVEIFLRIYFLLGMFSKYHDVDKSETLVQSEIPGTLKVSNSNEVNSE